MKLQGLQWMNGRTKRWLAIATGALAVYTAAGFWLVPLVLEKQIPRIGQSALARQASVGKVRFNPYTLRLVAQDLRLDEADGAPLFGIGELVVEMQWRSLIRRAWSFADITLTAPNAHLTIAPDGTFNLAELIATLPSERPEESTDSGLPRLVIEHFALAQGRVEMHDNKAGYANSFDPIDFSLNKFSTLSDRDGNYSFRSELASGGSLSWTGDVSVNPIRGSGELMLKNGSLPEPSVYLKPYTSVTVQTGRFDATLPYRFSYQDGKLDASFAGVSLALQDLAVSAPERAVSPPARASADSVRLNFDLEAGQNGEDFNLSVSNAAFSVAGLALAEGKRAPFKLARAGFTEGAVDLATRQASVARVFAEDGELALTRDANGQIDLAALLQRFVAAGEPVADAGASEQAAPDRADAPESKDAQNAQEPQKPQGAPTAPPWVAIAQRVELRNFGAWIADQASGIKLHVEDLDLTLEEAGSALSRPVRFNAALRLREGGQLAAQGTATPASGALQADVRIDQIALAPLQPLLSQHVKLTIGGSMSAQGKLATNGGAANSPALRYDGSFEIAGLALDEETGERFAGWKSVRADKLSASVSPNQLDIPELRVVEPSAILIIESDRSFNATRLLVRSPIAEKAVAVNDASAGPAQEAQEGKAQKGEAEDGDDPFPVRIRRMRFQNAKLDFTDLSLLPQFSAKIYELNGVVTGLSSSRETRSQLELDGRVDDFGLARIRGNLNAFAVQDNTTIDVVFKNLDMLSTSPYTMKFAGYKIAEGKLSLDLRYKVRNSQLEGANQIIIDKLTLGEKIDSPDAMTLPLELAIAILKDSDGRIDLDLPVSGDLNDPQFSYGAVIWKAIGNLLTRIATAPFRALGAMLGGGGENLESIDFDPGSDRLLPPEREKLVQVAQILAKRPQLKLSVPGQYSEAADGAALKLRAVRVEIGKRAGIQTPDGEAVGPLPLRDHNVRRSLRELFVARFGEVELKKTIETAEATEAAEAASNAGKRAKLSVWQRMGNMVEGEPQLAEAGDFYRALQERLVQNQPLPADAFTTLGKQRTDVILRVLKEAGVAEESAAAAATEAIDSGAGKLVPIKLGLASK